jgi:hypothetical protein
MSRWKSESPRAVDKPEPGFFRTRLIRKGPYVPARIEHGPKGWRATINGRAFDWHHDPVHAEGVFRIWLGGVEIDQPTYDYMIARVSYFERVDPQHPAANPTTPVDFNKLKPEF